MHPQRFRLQGALKFLRSFLLLLTLLLVAVQQSHAHESKPAVAVIKVSEEGIVNVSITTNIEAMIAGIGPDHNPGEFAKASRYASLRKMSAATLKAELNEFTGKLLEGIEIRADEKLLITGLRNSQIPADSNPKQARESVLTVVARLPKETKTLSWRWKKDFGIIALRLHSPSQEDVYNTYLEPGVRSEAFKLAKLLE